MRWGRVVWLCGALALGAGCASPRVGGHLGPIATLAPATRAVAGEPATTRPAAPWAADATAMHYSDRSYRRLLLEHVAPVLVATTDGEAQPAKDAFPLIDYMGLLRAPADLNEYLHVLARTGPESTPDAFPTQAHRLAYYINAYNACAIRAVLAQYPVETVYATDMPAFEYDWYFDVDGATMNLAGVRQAVMDQARGDVRAFFALSAAAVGSPPLASDPYDARNLYVELDAQMRECLSRPQFVQVAHEPQKLMLWWRIVRNADAFDAYYRSLYGSDPTSLFNVIMELASPGRRAALNRAVGYRIVELPFDRRLNDLAARADAGP